MLLYQRLHKIGNIYNIVHNEYYIIYIRHYNIESLIQYIFYDIL